MAALIIDDAIKKLYIDVGNSSGFNKAYTTPEYLKIICKKATRLEEVLSFYIIKGGVKNKTTLKRIRHLRMFACS